jgi:amino acid transporter
MFTLNLVRILARTPTAAPETRAHEKLPIALALPIFSSDALSSVAYGTEEILVALTAGVALTAPTGAAFPIALAVLVLLIIVSWSYAQTIDAYPNGGGAYLVARENLGERAGLAAAAALLLDYAFTVAASVAAGVAAVASASALVAPSLAAWTLEHRSLVGCVAVAAIAAANAGGLRKTGRLVAVPVYAFLAGMAALVVTGALRLETGSLALVERPDASAARTVGLLLLLRGFAQGCAALTGVEAIADCVGEFRSPARRNAKITLAILTVLLGGLFLGTTVLAVALGLKPVAGETLISQLARSVLGSGASYAVVLASTAFVLFLGANTSFAVFPTLAAELAEDEFLPRLRPASTVAVLGVVGAALLLAFAGDARRLVPLYSIGVFLSFTLSQAGMVRKWLARGARTRALVSALGTIGTAGVFVVGTLTSWSEGAWFVLVLVPAIVGSLLAVRSVRRALEPRRSLPILA